MFLFFSIISCNLVKDFRVFYIVLYVFIGFPPFILFTLGYSVSLFIGLDANIYI